MPAFLGAGARHFGFMLRGLKELAGKCSERGIAFFLLRVSMLLLLFVVGDVRELWPFLVALVVSLLQLQLPAQGERAAILYETPHKGLCGAPGPWEGPPGGYRSCQAAHLLANR